MHYNQLFASAVIYPWPPSSTPVRLNFRKSKTSQKQLIRVQNYSKECQQVAVWTGKQKRIILANRKRKRKWTTWQIPVIVLPICKTENNKHNYELVSLDEFYGISISPNVKICTYDHVKFVLHPISVDSMLFGPIYLQPPDLTNRSYINKIKAEGVK